VKIIIVYASAGRGHQAAAEAIYEHIKGHCPGHDARIIDALKFTNSSFSQIYSGGYYFLASHLRWLWSILYYFFANKYVSALFNFFSRLNSARLISYFLSENPDIILTTHFFPSDVASYLKRKGRLNSRLISIITDFGVHALWVSGDADTYIVGTDYSAQELLSKGVKKEKIKVFGIPISAKFLTKSEKPENKFSVLLVTGSFGFFMIEKIVDMLVQLDINLSVVCGNNRKLYERLSSKKYGNLRVFGFTGEMAKLMSGSDVFITKPGGLSIAEALAMDVPLVLINGIPGQETENAEILEDYGCAVNVKDLAKITDIILDLKNNPEKLRRLRANIQIIKKPKASEEISKYVCAGGPGPAG
jgi:processive 1,2-diacylglycerol beta-glucosyltransferase